MKSLLQKSNFITIYNSSSKSNVLRDLKDYGETRTGYYTVNTVNQNKYNYLTFSTNKIVMFINNLNALL